MKSAHKIFGIAILCLLLVGCNKFKPTLESKESFNKTFGSINWDNSKLDKKSVQSTCSDELIKLAIDNLPKTAIFPKKLHKKLYKKLKKLESDIDKVIKDFDLEGKLSEEKDFITITAKAKIFNARSKAKSSKSFLRRVKNRDDGNTVNWGKSEKKLDKSLLKIFKTISDDSFILKRGDFINYKNCKMYIGQFLDIDEISLVKIKLTPLCKVIMVCTCSEKSTIKNLNEGEVDFKTTIEARFPTKVVDFNELVFKNVGRPLHRVVRVVCCKEENEEKEKE